MANDRSNADGMFQQTLKKSVTIAGVGLHSGVIVTLTISPADANSGITFHRTDIRGAAGVIPARWDTVVDTRLCTVIGNEHGTTVGTIEHLMSALAGCGIDNAVVSLDGIEVPIMDGSAAPFVAAIEQAGIAVQKAPRRVIRILKPVVIGDGVKSASFTPDVATTYSFEIDFESAAISRQARGRSTPTASRTRSAAPAPSASCTRSRGCAKWASPAAARSTTRWSSPATR